MLLEEYNLFFNNRYLNSMGWYVKDFKKGTINEVVEHSVVEGRNGSVTERKGYYKDRIIDIELSVFDIENRYELLEELYYVFYNVEDDRLIYVDPIKCFRVKDVIINGESFASGLSYDVSIQIIASPFAESTEVTRLDNPSLINNFSAFNLEPKIEITGSGDIQVIVNGEVFQLKNVNGKAFIDSQLLIAIDGNGRNITNSGGWPVLKKGINTISVSGSVSKYTIEYNNLYR
ncbi:MAG: hypothetical protein ACRDD7_01300 [Peptostreptococcaceae bacterium]